MDPLQRARQDVEHHMDGILDNFKAGAQIAVVVWFPDQPDRDFVVTGGDLSQARDAIQRRIDRGHEAGGG